MIPSPIRIPDKIDSKPILYDDQSDMKTFSWADIINPHGYTQYKCLYIVRILPGGCGVVYKGLNTLTNTFVKIKVIPNGIPYNGHDTHSDTFIHEGKTYIVY